MKKLPFTTASLALAGLLLAAGPGDHDHMHARLGHKAPEFTLKDTQGKTHTLSEVLKKDDVKFVVLEWFNHDCPISNGHAEKKTMIKIVEEYKDDGVVFYGIDSTHLHQGKESLINEKIEKWGVNYPILTDFDGKVGHMYGAKTTPHMFIINEEGILVYNGAIDNKRTGDGETNYVAQALDQLLEGESVAVSRTQPYGCSVKYKG